MLKERMADGCSISFEQFCIRNTLRISEVGDGFSWFGKEREGGVFVLAWGTHGVEDVEAYEVLFVVCHDHAFVGEGSGGNEHVESASWPSSG